MTELTSRVSLDNVFRLVDALAARDGATAATDLHRFLAEGETPLRLLSLIARQFRLLAQTRALLDDAVPQAELAGALGVPPFLAGKLARQARHFPAAFLHAALRRLRNIDTEIKTGQVDPVLALDTFIAGVCGAARQPRTR